MPFVNRNISKTFKYTFSSNNLEWLSAFNQECSQASIRPRTNSVEIYDSGNTTYGYLLSANEEFTFCGLTNLTAVSAKGTSGSSIYIRTQYYGNPII